MIALVIVGVVIVIALGYVAILLRSALSRSILGGSPLLPGGPPSPSGYPEPGSGERVSVDGHDISAPATDEASPEVLARVAGLAEREEALARSEAGFLTRQASLAGFEGRLAEMTQGLAATQAELSMREEQLERRAQELATSAQELADLEQAAPVSRAGHPGDLDNGQLAEREKALADREAALDAALAEPDVAAIAAVADRESAAAARETVAADREAAVIEREAGVSQRESLLTERSDRLATRADRLGHREDQLTHREDLAAKDAARLEERRTQLEAERSQLLLEQQTLAQLKDQQLAELERIAGLTAEAAAAELTASITEQAKRAAAISVRDLEAEAKRDADRRAREVVSQAIQRVASQQTSESVVSVIHLPGDDMKGRIIGREGRNIRTFETLTGVNVMIDDTPEAVSLSCFDPVRREIARVTLGALVADGRIHPQRIEDAYEQAKAEVEAQIDVTGRDTLLDVGLDDAHPELVTLLGRLKYRTSYGQNVLGHLVETAHIASGMAAELGLGKEGVSVVKRAAFFHDIGKALTHEVEGSHALVGADVARRCGESEEVVHAIAAHHLEIPPQTVEAWLTIGSDSCSGGRPGARRESLEAYVDRLKRIEEIAYSRDGVERVFAMSAGRELRVMVLPEEVDDLGSQVLARDIAKQIEDELTYPGQIKVTVIRESRASETAH